MAYSVACAHLRRIRSHVPSPVERLGIDESVKMRAAQRTTGSQCVSARESVTATMLDSRSHKASGRGTPVQVRDGPAAVRGDALVPRRHWPTGREGGTRGRPESEDPPSRRHSNPSRKGGLGDTQDPGSRRGGTRGRTFGSPLGRARADRRKEQDAVRHDRTEPESERQCTRRARSCIRRRRALLPRPVHLVRAVCRSDRPLRRRRPDRLGVQGEREVAAGRSRRGEAPGRRHGALVLGAVRRGGRAEDARARAGGDAEELLPRLCRGRQRHAHGRRRSSAPRRRTSNGSDAGRDAGRRGLCRLALRARARDARRSGAVERARVKWAVALCQLALILVLAGCGGDDGSATLWVTRDRGHRVLLVARVPSGLTAMQALDRKVRLETAYGGRFVVAIDGVSSAPRHDWFYFVDGVPPSRSAAEVRLKDGDVLWWDYRSWRQPNEVPAVVGSFPQPFLRGPAVVVGTGRLAAKLARVVHGHVATRAPK